MGMKFNAHLTIARSEEEAGQRLQAVNADQEGVLAMAPKMRHYCIKLEGVPVAGANIIKQVMLKAGAEAAESVNAYAGRGESTDVILMGTLDQYEALREKIKEAPFGLSELARDLSSLMAGVERKVFKVPAPRGELELGKKPLIMGIINATPDSFYDGGRFFDQAAAVEHGKKLMREGADIIDVGGESTRPSSEPVSAEEELERVMPVIEALFDQGAFISIDTGKAVVAGKAVEAGAAVINDVTALADPDMAGLAADTGTGLILMHMKGTPRTMQKDPRYHDLFGEIISYLREGIDRAVSAGVSEESIIVDPGIGFGKTVAHNLEIIRDLWRLRSLGRPILLGPSNKSFIGAVLGAQIDERLEGTAAALVAGVLSGAHILRVHDPAGVKQYVDMAWAIAEGEAWQ